MSTLRTMQIRRKLSSYEAVRFEGSSVNAKAILDWAQEGGALVRGHYREGMGQEPDSLFIPLPTGEVCRVDRGSYLLRWGPGRFVAVGIEEFADCYEVVP